MENYLINYTDEALQDIDAIYNYISVELKAPAAAAAQVKRIAEEVKTLNIFPKRYRVVDWQPWASMGMRQLQVDNFIVFYVISEKEKAVQIVRIFYGKRNIPDAINGSIQ